MNRTRKSTDLAPEGAWFKSSYSSGAEGNCVEAADRQSEMGVRDSKNKGPALVFQESAWAAFLSSVRAGKFEPLA
ncbi:DUF397 domain-containing protein [Streptomyces sp. NPDC059070]|uniref:DUF397 domain-containing protein n=1 Tax=Streptomyces sp. NPDC059070 TaxID=3346713 RepID=UPI0036CF22A7